MEKSESIINLIQATIRVMEAVKGIDKSMTIGSGQNSYKGVPDQEVKKIIGEAMAKNGLAIFPIDLKENTVINQWDEVDIYSKSNPKDMKHKQSIFTKVETTYLLTHVSGEYITVKGYGHGVDTQDKGAGKATTYALKYALLYIFLTPTGKIDDSDNIHSDDLPKKETPEPKAKPETLKEKAIKTAVAEMFQCENLEGVQKCWSKWKTYQTNPEFIKTKDLMKLKYTKKAPINKTSELLPNTENWEIMKNYLLDEGTMENLKTRFDISIENEVKLINEVNLIKLNK